MTSTPRFITRYNANSAGSFRVVDMVRDKIIVPAVNQDQARFSATWLNERYPAGRNEVPVALALNALVIEAWRQYCAANPGAPGVFFPVR